MELHPDVAWGPVWAWLTVSRAWRTGKRAKRDEKGNHVALGTFQGSLNKCDHAVTPDSPRGPGGEAGGLRVNLKGFRLNQDPTGDGPD